MRVVDVEKNRLPGDTADTPITRTVLLAALCIQSFPFALLKVLILGTTQWGKRIKKNPGNNKNNADRQRFQGGFVETDPPFDYLAQPFFKPTIYALPLVVFTSLCRQTCANPVQTVKLSLLLSAITEFNA